MFCINGCAYHLKEGWNETTIKIAAEGCTIAVLNPQIEEYKKRSNFKGDGIPPSLEEKLPTLKREISNMCSCLIEQSAMIMPLQKFNNTSAKEKQALVMNILCSNKCKLAFNIPADCSNFKQE